MYSFKSITGFTLGAFAVASVLAVLSAGPALAAEPSKSIRVGYGDLDLSTQQGVASLYNRIRGAAHQVCGYEGASFEDKAIWKSCFTGAIDNAVATVNNPRLTALHTGQSPSLTAMLSK
jgi:UrcA family protein